MWMLRSAPLLLLLLPSALTERAGSGLSDPSLQPKFSVRAPNPLDPSFVFDVSSGFVEVSVSEGVSETGLVGPDGKTPVTTKIWGYGTPELGHTWPGRTFVVQSNVPLHVEWLNKIPIGRGYLLTGKNNGDKGDFSRRSVVDTSIHWCYSIPGYDRYTIEENGTPIVVHLHGSHADFSFDGGPEFFYTPDYEITGPQWSDKVFYYDNTQAAACLFYHDHALGITRLNMYAGMAGFYIIRDDFDTGETDNPLRLPAFPYEVLLAIQDRMFKENGDLFYPAFRGDPFYDDFIAEEGAEVNPEQSNVMAEIFGDHMVVNGKIWPKIDAEPRNYRLRLLNGCDSRYLVLQFMAVPLGQSDFTTNARPVSFYVIGGDQGLGWKAVKVESLLVEPSARNDVVIDFGPLVGQRVIMKNIGGDEPFGGDIPGPQLFEFSDRIMAFDITLPLDESSAPDQFDPDLLTTEPPAIMSDTANVDRTRRLLLVEGKDQLGRLQPLVGTVDPATDMNGFPIHWPDTHTYRQNGLVGQMIGSMTWRAPTTENPRLNHVEDWEFWNLSEDAHPMHLHLTRFFLISRRKIVIDSMANGAGVIDAGVEPAGDGTYLSRVPTVEHDGSVGEGFMVMNPTSGDLLDKDSFFPEDVVDHPLDSISALPGQITTIRAKFDRPGRYVWHCHVLAHEDHAMMRIFNVGPIPRDQQGALCNPPARRKRNQRVRPCEP